MTLPAPGGSNPRRFQCLVLALIFLGAVYVAERAAYWSRYWERHVPSVAAAGPLLLTVGEVAFRLPSDYISTYRQRQKAVSSNSRFAALRLAMTWPELSAANAFDTDGQQILVELEHNPGRESMRARLDPFYRRLARGRELNGPDGLRVLTLSARRSASKDLIVYDPSRRNGFIARCMKNKPGGKSVCHRAIVLASGLELRYRFSQDLLHDWRVIDSAIIKKVKAFRQS